MRRLILAPAVLTALVLAGASCTTEPAAIDDQKTAPSTPSATQPVETSVAPMSLLQAKKALLTLRDLPAGWTGGKATEEPSRPEKTGSYDPAECVVVLHPLHERGAPLKKVGVTFTSATDFSISETVTTWPVTQRGIVQRVADTLSRCSAFKLTYPTGEESTFTARQVALGGLSDVVAVHFEETSGFRYGMHVGWAVRGGGVLRLQMGDSYSEALFVSTLSKATSRLEDAAG
ncbi:hypothetical protein [Kribbella sp. CA-293567]|uniref:hypothetical protein n=1 Tax=Kribbella sp. CA-293567 TaxID=3002436 RepID=UPI0022DDF8CE|nr:hypothetical protein [Kribbella sp. CA-293567]WBQ04015.1 hypothetical protein OX958_29115 [Kribbella sp. CA-293567]